MRLSLAAVWLTLPVVGAIVAATLEPIPPHDYWWHLAMGRLIAAGHFPDTNLFLYTVPANLEFVNQPWLGQWLMWLAYDLFGHGGPIVLRNIFLGASFGLLTLTAWRRSADPRTTGALGLLAALLAYPVLTVRTRMFAFLPFAAVLWAVYGVVDGRLSRWWLLVVFAATAFWANVHGSFVLAVAIVGAVGLGQVVGDLIRDRRLNRRDAALWFAVLIGTILAGAMTPLGFGVYGYVAQLTMESSVAHSVTEWLPPDLGELRGQLFAVAMLATLGLLARDRARLSIGDALLFAGTLILAAGALRSMFWWAAVVPLVCAGPLSRLLGAGQSDEPSASEAAAVGCALAVLATLVVAVQPGVARSAIGELTATGQARQSGEGSWLLNHENALSAVEKVRVDARHRIFHDQAIGGMLEVLLTDAESPHPVAYVDQRMEFVPDSVWDRYFALSRAAPRWDAELDRLGVDTLILAPDSQWALIQAALLHDGWRLALVDQSHVVLYRDSLNRAQNPAK